MCQAVLRTSPAVSQLTLIIISEIGTGHHVPHLSSMEVCNGEASIIDGATIEKMNRLR